MISIFETKQIRRVTGRISLLAVLTMGCIEGAAARSGDLDNHFGSGGAAIVNLPVSDSIWDISPMMTAVDATNRCLIAFYLTDADQGMLAALDSEGNLDTSFGVAGYIESPAHSFISDLRVDSLDRIVTLEKWDAASTRGSAGRSAFR